MKLRKSALKDVFWIEPDLLEDERGFFAKVYDEDIFYNAQLNIECTQCNVSHNKKERTLRGLHYQIEPFAQAKYLTCTNGVIQDVIIDLRKDSPTYMKWDSFILSRENRQWLYIPEGFAHGFLTLTDDVDIFYHLSKNYNKDAEAGIRWDDKQFDIYWLKEPLIISERDQKHPDYEEK